jgi:hypothetical protein
MYRGAALLSPRNAALLRAAFKAGIVTYVFYIIFTPAGKHLALKARNIEFWLKWM